MGEDRQLVNKEDPIIWRWAIKPQDDQHQNLIISLRLQYEQKPKIEPTFNNDSPPKNRQICADMLAVDVRKSWFDLYTGYIIAATSFLTLIATGLPIWDRRLKA